MKKKDFDGLLESIDQARKIHRGQRYTQEELDAMDRLAKETGQTFATPKEALAYLAKAGFLRDQCDHKHKWESVEVRGTDYVSFIRVCKICQKVENVRTML